MSRDRLSWIAVLGVCVLAMGMLGAQKSTGKSTKSAPTTRPVAVQQTSGSEGINLRRTVIVDVVGRTKDAVLNISATKTVQQRVSPFGIDPFWQGFNMGDIVRVPADSLGSGFLIHRDGYVVTNHHVVDRARKIHVELADGRKLPAELVSSDPDADLAILKIHSDKPLPALELGDSSDLLIGEPVIAVGNPLGFSHSVSTGIVSAVHRDLKDEQGKVMLGDLIQTDAAINPGNSGGPLLNAYGQVIGINTAIRGDAQNIGFAIQVNRLRDLIPELMNPVHVTHVDIPLQLKERRTIAPPSRVSARVCVGDKNWPIKTIDGVRPGNIVDAYAVLLRVKPGQKEVIVEFEDGVREAVKTKVASAPATVLEARKKLGITIEPVTPMLADKYNLQSEDGLFITEVLRDSIAANAGLKPGDIIVQVGQYRTPTLDRLGALLRYLPERGKVRFGIIRGDRVGYALLEFGNRE